MNPGLSPEERAACMSELGDELERMEAEKPERLLAEARQELEVLRAGKLLVERERDRLRAAVAGLLEVVAAMTHADVTVRADDKGYADHG